MVQIVAKRGYFARSLRAGIGVYLPKRPAQATGTRMRRNHPLMGCRMERWLVLWSAPLSAEVFSSAP